MHLYTLCTLYTIFIRHDEKVIDNYRLIETSCILKLNYECPPATILNILIFSTSHRQACQMMHRRQKSVAFVGMGGYDSSE